ncbi:YcaO-like family protein [Aerococcus vaginalis]
MEDVSYLGLSGFYTFRDNIDGSFRPCSSRLHRKSAIRETYLEKLQIESIKQEPFHTYTYEDCLQKGGKIIFPKDLYPYVWNKKNIEDELWYNSKNVSFIEFYEIKNHQKTFIPKDISIYTDHIQQPKLSWANTEGYGFDFNKRIAITKSIMELIEKENIMFWWYGSIPTDKLIIDNKILINVEKIINSNNAKLTLLNVRTNLPCYVIISIIEMNNFPFIAYGSAANFDIVDAALHAVYESISTIAGLTFQAVKLKTFDYKPEDYICNYNNYPQRHTSNFVSKSFYQYNSLKELGIYYTIEKCNTGYLSKAFSTKMQPYINSDTVPLTKRFMQATGLNSKNRVYVNHPFI